MSGYNSKLKYDDRAYQQKVVRSTKPGDYRLNENTYTNCKKCLPNSQINIGYSGNGQINNRNSDAVDIESMLRGLDKSSTKDYNKQVPVQIDQYIDNTPPCDPRFESQSSRYLTPAYEVRGVNTSDMNLSYPLHDPQCGISFLRPIDTRLEAKDKHRTTWTDPMDQQMFNPKSQKKKRKCNIRVNCQ
jgi:hypothetical protein